MIKQLSGSSGRHIGARKPDQISFCFATDTMRDDVFNNRPMIKSQTVDFIVQIPLVAQAIQVGYRFLKDHPLLLRLFDLAECLFIEFLLLILPLAKRFNKTLISVDNYAVRTLQYAKDKVPYPFEVTWNDLYANGKVQAHQLSQDVYENRIKAPAKSVYDQGVKVVEQLQQNENEYIKKVGASISSMHEKVLSVAKEISQKSSQDVSEGEKQASSLVKSVVGEIEGLQKFAATLPSEAQKRLDPYIHVLNTTYKDLSAEALDGKVPILDRLNKVVSYLQNKTVPELQKAVTAAPKSNKKKD